MHKSENNVLGLKKKLPLFLVRCVVYYYTHPLLYSLIYRVISALLKNLIIYTLGFCLYVQITNAWKFTNSIKTD